MKRVITKGALVALAAWLCLSVQALAQTNEIVDATYVANALEHGAIVWDVRATPAYQAGHIPGAVNVGNITAVLRDPVTENWLPTAQIEKLLGDAGIDLLNEEVIVYGRTGGMAAYFGLLTIRYFGGKSGKVYQGGIDDWKAAGMISTTDDTGFVPIDIQLVPQEGVVVWTDEMVERVAEAEAGTVQIVDVRTPREYTGRVVSAIRGGHIPRAVNMPVQQNWSTLPTAEVMVSRQCGMPDCIHLKPTADLDEVYASLDPDKETIVYCQSGVRASQTASVLRALGFTDVKVYKPGWLGYAGALSAPAEDEVFVNIGAMNRRIAGLQARIDELERDKDSSTDQK